MFNFLKKLFSANVNEPIKPKKIKTSLVQIQPKYEKGSPGSYYSFNAIDIEPATRLDSWMVLRIPENNPFPEHKAVYFNRIHTVYINGKLKGETKEIFYSTNSGLVFFKEV